MFGDPRTFLSFMKQGPQQRIQLFSCKHCMIMQLERVMDDIMKTIEDGLGYLQIAEQNVNGTYAFAHSTVEKPPIPFEEGGFDLEGPFHKDDILNFIEQTINDSLDILQRDGEDSEMEASSAKEVEDDKFVSNLMGEEQALAFVLDQIDEGLAALRIGENEPGNFTIPSEDIDLEVPIDKDGALEFIDKTLKDAFEILHIRDEEVKLPKKIESDGGENPVEIRERSDTCRIRYPDGVLTLHDNREETSYQDKENVSLSSLVSSSNKEKNSLKRNTCNKRSDNGRITESNRVLTLRDNFEEISKANASSSSLVASCEKQENSIKIRTFNKRSDNSWIREPGGSLTQQEPGEEGNGSQPEDGSKSMQPSLFNEKMNFWRKKMGK